MGSYNHDGELRPSAVGAQAWERRNAAEVAKRERIEAEHPLTITETGESRPVPRRPPVRLCAGRCGCGWGANGSRGLIEDRYRGHVADLVAAASA